MNVVDVRNRIANCLWPALEAFGPNDVVRSGSPVLAFEPDHDAVIVTSPPATPPESPRLQAREFTVTRPKLSSSRRSTRDVPRVPPALSYEAEDLSERRELAKILSNDYLLLVSNIDATCIMGMRHNAGLSTESPKRLGTIIRVTIERLGVMHEANAIRASTLSRDTLSERFLLQGSAIQEAEVSFILAYAWGLAYNVADSYKCNDARKLALASHIARLLPVDMQRFELRRTERAEHFAASNMPLDTLETLRTYLQSHEGRRYASENRAAEEKIEAMFRKRGVEDAVDQMCERMFDDWE